MIRFKQQQVRPAEVNFHGLRHVAEIRDVADFDTIRAEAEPARVGGIVWDGEAIDLDIAYTKSRSCLEVFHCGLKFAPIDRGGGEPR